MLGTFARDRRHARASGSSITFVLGVAGALVGASIAGRVDRRASPTPTRSGGCRPWPPAAGSRWSSRRRLGFAIATLARSQLAGIGAGIAFYFGEAFASIFLPDIIKYMPFAVARASMETRWRRGRVRRRRRRLRRGAPGRTRRCCSSRLWLVGSLLVTVLFTERAEITG